MRILHLIDAASPQATAPTLRLLADSLDTPGCDRSRVLLLGDTHFQQTAQAAGVRPATALGVPMGRAWLGWSSLRRRVLRGPRPDLIHCWSIGCFSAAAILFADTPRLLTLTTPPSGRAAHWLRTLLGDQSKPSVVLTTSNTVRRSLLEAGVTDTLVHALRPGIDMGLIHHHDRTDLRQRWQTPNNKTTTVLALLSDPPVAADAIQVTLSLLIADEVCATEGRDLRLLIHPDQSNRLRAQHILSHMNKAHRLILEPELAQPWSVLPGADIALALGPHAGGLSLLWAMCANTPIIGEARYAISEVVEDRHSAMLAPPDSPKATAQRITQLTRDPQLAWQLRDTARHEAYSFFSRQRYRQSLNHVYTQLRAVQPIEIPPLEPTGGLRFAGRA